MFGLAKFSFNKSTGVKSDFAIHEQIFLSAICRLENVAQVSDIFGLWGPFLVGPCSLEHAEND